MSNDTVSQFYSNPQKDSTYLETYRLDHQPRMKALLEKYGLVEGLKGKRIVDVGGGVGFLGELLDSSTDYWVIDGAFIPDDQKLCKGTWVRVDLDREAFGCKDIVGWGINKNWGIVHKNVERFDSAFLLETIEHLGSPYYCLEEIKKLVKIGGDVFISTPTETVLHNTPYPSLFWPSQNFQVFLEQMALPVRDFYIYEPKGRGWPAYQYKCENRPWSEKRLIFPKAEEKFRNCTALEATNL